MNTILFIFSFNLGLYSQKKGRIYIKEVGGGGDLSAWPFERTYFIRDGFLEFEVSVELISGIFSRLDSLTWRWLVKFVENQSFLKLRTPFHKTLPKSGPFRSRCNYKPDLSRFHETCNGKPLESKKNMHTSFNKYMSNNFNFKSSNLEVSTRGEESHEKIVENGNLCALGTYDLYIEKLN